MAYGKIKADTLVYDNSGTDTDVTIASLGAKADLNSPTFTGTPTVPGYATLASPTFTGTINGAALTLSGNLTVNGTTTTIDSTTLTVEDKNIELGKVDTPTDTTADGGGITLKGATDTWDFNQNISIINPASSGDAFLNIIGGEGGASVIEFKADEGDDNADYWRVQNAGDGILGFRTKASGSWVEEFRVETTGITVNGSVTDDKGNVRSIPAKDQGGASEYTLIASDAGKTILRYGGGLTIPNSVMTTGDAVTIINASGSDITLTQGSGFTLYNTADASTGNRTLAGRGMATIWFPGSSSGYISGAGLS